MLCSGDGDAVSMRSCKPVYKAVSHAIIVHGVQVSKTCCLIAKRFICRPLYPTMDSIGCVGCAFSDRCSLSSGDDADAGMLLVCPEAHISLNLMKTVFLALLPSERSYMSSKCRAAQQMRLWFTRALGVQTGQYL